MSKRIGVLALQGAFQKHIDLLHTLGVSAFTVRSTNELNNCDGLIIPGGESTTMSLLMQEYGLHEPIRQFAETHPVMGVCAGMILMATEVDDERVQPLGLIPFKALRNHYGRQVHSFTTDINLDYDSNGVPFSAQFIRAPGVDKLDDAVEVLARHDDQAIMLKYKHHLALSFHPELTPDTRIHEFWLNESSVAFDDMTVASSNVR